MVLLVSGTTWVALGLAIGATGVAVLVSLVVLVVLVRGRKPERPTTETALAVSTTGVETMMADMADALELAREETRRSRQLNGIRESLELDAVLERTLETAESIHGVDAAMIVLPAGDPDGGVKPLIATVGMSTDEAAQQPLEGPPEGQRARAVRIAYSYGPEQGAERALIRGGIAVPLQSEAGDPIGTLAVFWRTEREASEQETARIDELAASAGPAIDNSYRFREARQLADIDALTKLHNRRYFHETLAREVARGHRYDRRLALVLFDIDDFKAINDRVGHLAGDALLAEVGERVKSVVRGADVACRVGGDEFAVILPESTRGDAAQLYRRLQFAVASRPAGSADRLHLSAGVAELQPDDDAQSLFQRADDALYKAKEEGKGRAVDARAEGSSRSLDAEGGSG